VVSPPLKIEKRCPVVEHRFLSVILSQGVDSGQDTTSVLPVRRHFLDCHSSRSEEPAVRFPARQSRLCEIPRQGTTWVVPTNVTPSPISTIP
jgi:hypothetical protein